VDGAEITDIPDSVTDQWDMDEGSGTTLNNIEGTADASLQTDAWRDDASYYGGTAPEFDGSSDYWVTDSTIDCNGGQVSAVGWIYAESSDQNATILGCLESDGSQPGSGWQIMNDTDDNGLRIIHNGSNVGTVLNDLPMNEWRMIGAAVDGDETTLYEYDNSGLIGTDSAAGTRTTGDLHFGGMARTDQSRYIGGLADVSGVAAGEVWGQSEFDSFHDETKRE